MAGPAVGVGGVVQGLDDAVVGERLEEPLAAAESAMVPGGEGELLLAECLHDADPVAVKVSEQQPHRAAHAQVGVRHHLAMAI